MGNVSRTHCVIDADTDCRQLSRVHHSVRTNGPKVTGLNALDYHVWGAMIPWSLREVPATSDKYFWVKSSSSLDLESLEWLSAGSHWQLHCEFHQAIKSVHQR